MTLKDSALHSTPPLLPRNDAKKMWKESLRVYTPEKKHRRISFACFCILRELLIDYAAV